MSGNLRRYGHGKFDLVVDQYVYGLSLEGWCADETGESDGPGWYGLIHGPLVDEVGPLMADEVAFLMAQAGAILVENSDGFVHVEYFERKPALTAAWEGVTEEVSSWYGDDEPTD